MLEALRRLNSGYPLFSVHDEAFRRFGRVIDFPCGELIAACQRAAEMPESGSRYLPSMPELEALDITAVSQVLRGEGPFQIGCCWGHASRMNCMEYHRSSEHNIAVSDMVLFLAAQQDMDGFELDSSKVAAFYVPKGTVIEVYATTLHFCPCEVTPDGFRCIVILPHGTNHPLKSPRPAGGDGRLLWAKDKWLITHPDNAPVVARGAYAGIHGKNHQLNY